MIIIILLCSILTIVNLRADNHNIEWATYKTVADKCPIRKNYIVPQKSKFRSFMQKYVHHLREGNAKDWNKLRNKTIPKISMLLSNEDAEPLIIFEWFTSSHKNFSRKSYIIYKSMLLTDKFVLYITADRNHTELKKNVTSKELIDIFNSDTVLLNNYKGHASTGNILYLVSLWKNKKIKNTFLFLGLPLFIDERYGTEKERKIAKLFMKLSSTIKDAK